MFEDIRKTCRNCKHFNTPKMTEPCVGCKEIITITPNHWEPKED